MRWVELWQKTDVGDAGYAIMFALDREREVVWRRGDHDDTIRTTFVNEPQVQKFFPYLDARRETDEKPEWVQDWWREPNSWLPESDLISPRTDELEFEFRHRCMIDPAVNEAHRGDVNRDEFCRAQWQWSIKP
jgi:hypothetical protein